MARSLPVLRPCPTCGVVLQGGRGPHRLAHHLCRPPVADPEQELLKLLLDRARTTVSLRDLAAAFAAVSGSRRGTGSSSPEAANGDQLLRWLNRQRVRAEE